MSAYLQRLVASSRGTASSIRPSVGSLYGARLDALATGDLRETPAERQFEGTIVSPPDGRRAEQSPPALIDDHRSSASDLEQPRTHKPFESHLAEQPDAYAGPPSDFSSYHPLLSPVQNDSQDQREATVAQIELQPATERVTAVQNAAPTRLEALPREQFSLPLMARTARTSAGSLAPRATAQPAVQRDEIEINIGRIEVIAVPPPAQPRAAQRAPRKSINLGDYLSGSRGRSS
ncbi:MAG TPA: hypothetical protein VGD59_12815 [Acidisarcina sp.]